MFVDEESVSKRIYLNDIQFMDEGMPVYNSSKDEPESPLYDSLKGNE